MAVTEGDLFCDKQMTSNLRASKRGEPEKSSKSKRSSTGAMTLKVEDPPLVRITLNEEWANKMQNISTMLNSKKEGGPLPAYAPLFIFFRFLNYQWRIFLKKSLWQNAIRRVQFKVHLAFFSGSFFLRLFS
nr:hypothetical protein [Solanum melongena]WMB96735.1 hypothetical protein [Solanum melongena]WMB96906.1 hypothetical protein [Solanum melongena]WMB97096.1 hypothetical protein [Solanum aethiopicum]